jgi:hypothetical protein
MSTLNETFLSTIEGSIYSMYSKVQIPEAVALILGKLGQVGFYNSTFDEMYKKIGSYIGQGLKQQQNQPAISQPSQPPAGQQPAPQQQQANQLQQNQQNQLVPQPHVIRPNIFQPYI